jgi:ubiquitin-protein ligase
MWFLDNPSRVTKERFEIDKLFSEVNWLKKADWVIVDSQLCVNADIVINNKTYSVQMTYPSLFPLVPPSVKPLDIDRRWSYHQYGAGGDLCLEWGPDNWQETVTGADLLRSTYKLLEIDRPLEKEIVSMSTDVPPENDTRYNLTKGGNKWLKKDLHRNRSSTSFARQKYNCNRGRP